MLLREGRVGTEDQRCGWRTQLNKIYPQGHTANKQNRLPEKSLGTERRQKQPEKKKKITQRTPAGCYGAAGKDAKKLSGAAAKGKAKPAFISATINDFRFLHPLICKKTPNNPNHYIA